MADQIDFDRPYVEPSNPDEPGKRDSLHENKVFRLLTFGVLVFAIFWAPGLLILHLHPSKLTITGFLAALIFYSGEYIGWERPHLPKRNHKQAPWRNRA